MLALRLKVFEPIDCGALGKVVGKSHQNLEFGRLEALKSYFRVLLRVFHELMMLN